jgi:hypothetical protein
VRAEAVIAFACVVAGCDDLVAPEQPSWQVDVMPLFAANCVRCHAYPFRGNGATALRLDSFDDTVLPETDDAAIQVVANGAAKSALAIYRRTHDVALLPSEGVMPPDRRLNEYELTIIRNWVARSNDQTAIRGAGRPDNHIPELVLAEVDRTATTVTFSYELTDRDHDLVVATVIRPPFDQDDLVPALVVGNATTGRGQLVWNIAGLPAGEYPLHARLDDGADVDPVGDADYIEVELGSVTLP